MKLKNKVLVGLLSLCAAFAGVGAGALTAQEKVTAVAETPAYTIVESPVMVKHSMEYDPNGNINLFITLPQFDYDLVNQDFSVNRVDVPTAGAYEKLDAIGFFDNILIAGYTLKELGCNSFWSEVFEIGSGEPQNIIRMPLHVDPTLWNSLIGEGKVTYQGAAGKTTITIKEGALIPGYKYLKGLDDAVVYRMGCEYTTFWSSFGATYSYETFGKTNVEEMAYVQGHDGVCGYFGVSLEGDDYLGDGAKLELKTDIYWAYQANYPNQFFSDSILVNGETGKINQYGLVNLGEAGKGMFAFQITVPEAEIQSITIPAGTIFPAKAINDLRGANPHFVYMAYQTQTTATYSLNENGEFVFIPYVDLVTSDLQAYKAEEGYFRAEEAAQRTAIINAAVVALDSVNTEAEINAIAEEAKAAVDALKSAAQYADEELAPFKAEANEIIANYNKDVVYFEEDQALYEAAIADGLAAVKAAKNQEEINAAVTAAKAVVDALPNKERAINTAKATLDAYLADEEYRDAQKAERESIIAAAKADIDAAATATIVAEIVAKACADIDEIPTASEMTSTEMDGYKAAALAKVNAKKATVDYTRYSEEDIAKINELYRAVKETIANATSEAEMNAAADKFAADIDALPKMKAENGKTGCAAVVGSGMTFGLVAMLGVAMALKKKEDIA